MLQTGLHIEVSGHRTAYLHVLRERRAGVDQHIRACFQRAIVLRAHAFRRAKRVAAYRRCWVAGVVAIAVRLRICRRICGERAAGVQMPALRRGGRRPIIEVTPGVRAHHEEAHWLCAQMAAVAFELRIEPGERFACHRWRAGELPVIPGADEQVWLASGGAQSLIVLKLPVQEEIIPAALEVDGDGHVAYGGAEVYGFPVRS